MKNVYENDIGSGKTGVKTKQNKKDTHGNENIQFR